MQPEILHRCSSCGAAIREPAMFCPECGKSLTPGADSQAPEEPSQAEPQVSATESPSEEAPHPTPAPPTPPVEETKSDSLKEVDQPESIAAAELDDASKATNAPAENETPGTVERTREKLQRASTAARGALKENVKRVDNIRHASSAVIEEATYDPSLRFVLVALGLFVVALILLVLSKVMG